MSAGVKRRGRRSCATPSAEEADRRHREMVWELQRQQRERAREREEFERAVAREKAALQ